MIMGEKVSKEEIDVWPEIFDDIIFDTIPTDYVNSVFIHFKNNQTWEIKNNRSNNDHEKLVFVCSLVETFNTYIDSIAKVEYKLDLISFKEDAISNTNEFFKENNIA